MNKNDLVSAVADAAGLTKADAGRAVDGVFDSISGALKSGGDVRIVGFGTFSVAHRAATTGRNPRTGETIQIKASKQPKFKAGAPFKRCCEQLKIGLFSQTPARYKGRRYLLPLCERSLRFKMNRVVSSAGRATRLHRVGRGSNPSPPTIPYLIKIVFIGVLDACPAHSFVLTLVSNH